MREVVHVTFVYDVTAKICFSLMLALKVECLKGA